MNFFSKRVFCACFITIQLFANETIIADRPGFSTGTYTIQPETFNLEMGYNYAFDNKSSKYDIQDIALFEFRTGITNNIEFDLIWDGLSYMKDSSKIDIHNITIGGKYRIIENCLYNITLMGLVSLPTGSDTNFNTQNIIPLIGILWDYSVDENISFFGTLQSTTYKSALRIYDVQTALGIALTHTNNIGSFIEIYAISEFSSPLVEESIINAGFTYLLNKNIQLDIHSGLGLTQGSNDFFGFGIAIQFK